MLTTFDAVQSALKDPRLSACRTGGWVMRAPRSRSDVRAQLIDMQRLFARALLFVDKPTHPRLRQAMQVGFRPEAIQKMSAFVDATVNELVDNVEASCGDDSPFDFIETFARQLPARVIARFLGFRHVDQQRFLTWSSVLAQFIGSVRPSEADALAARTGLLGMAEYIETCLDTGDFEEDKLFGVLVRAQQRGEIESGPEMLSQCAMLLFAGYETTRHLLGTAVYWLLREPGMWAALENPARLRSAVRELLRWDSPVQYTGRRASSSFTLHGKDIRRGDLVLPLIGSANRDPSRYEEPDRINLDRSVGVPLSFGSGPHVCIGAGLTLMEAECAIGVLVRRWPRLQLCEAGSDWLDIPLYRGLKTLMVRRSGSPPATA
ncbi:cytochrome P450 [Burkholderia sp. D-99]|uniref:cytochrome P450 n=1 Tax=Burkholderia sp. D-99 TaxID=2717316 RepID=UPI0032618BA2